MHFSDANAVILKYLHLIEELCSKCEGSGQMRSEVERMITHFPSVIREANKRQDTPPHCMFAIEELVGKALNGLKLALLPGEWLII